MVAVLFSYGCGKDAVRPSEDSQLATGALDRIEVIRSAYLIKDTGILQQQLDAKLAEDILKNISFNTAELSFTPRMVRITDEAIIVSLGWQGAWQLEKDKKLENRGVANLVLHRESMKLMQLEGDNPFLVPLEK